MIEINHTNDLLTIWVLQGVLQTHTSNRPADTETGGDGRWGDGVVWAPALANISAYISARADSHVLEKAQQWANFEAQVEMGINRPLLDLIKHFTLI